MLEAKNDKYTFHMCTSSQAKKKQEFVVIANNSIDKTDTFTYLLSLMDVLWTNLIA